MYKFRFVLIIVLLLFLAACATSEPADPPTPTTTTAAATAVPVEPTATNNPVATTVDIEVTATTAPTAEPETSALTEFITTLENAVINQDYAQMQSLMSPSLAVGGWRSEWRTYQPDQVIAEFQSGSLPAPLGVRFSDISEERLGELLGQPATSFFSPDTNVVAALHSGGWGQSTVDDAVLFVTEEAGSYYWYGFLYTTGRFADAFVLDRELPAGLLYRDPQQGVFQVQLDGHHRRLLDSQQANLPNIRLSSDGRYAAYLNEERQLWIIDTLDNHEEQLASEYNLSNYLAWANDGNLFIGVWLSPDEAEGPNNGHAAVVHVQTRTVRILNESRLSTNHPALSPDGLTAAFDIFPLDNNDTATSWFYNAETGLQQFDPAAFTASGEVIDSWRFNPAWSPDGRQIAWLASTGERVGLQIFDLEAQTVSQIFDWDPARFGATIPAPIWSPDGRWLVLEVWANGPSGSGIWLLSSDGLQQTLIDPDAHQPSWANAAQIAYSVNSRTHLYDIDTAQISRLVLPEGGWLLGVTEIDYLQSLPLYFTINEVNLPFILALQDVVIYSGPNATFSEVGTIAAGQLAKVTGQSSFGPGFWRVICPDDTVGSCWVTADGAFTEPSDG